MCWKIASNAMAKKSDVCFWFKKKIKKSQIQIMGSESGIREGKIYVYVFISLLCLIWEFSHQFFYFFFFLCLKASWHYLTATCEWCCCCFNCNIFTLFRIIYPLQSSCARRCITYILREALDYRDGESSGITRHKK